MSNYINMYVINKYEYIYIYIYYKQEYKLLFRLPFGGHCIPWKRQKIGPQVLLTIDKRFCWSGSVLTYKIYNNMKFQINFLAEEIMIVKYTGTPLYLLG